MGRNTHCSTHFQAPSRMQCGCQGVTLVHTKREYRMWAHFWRSLRIAKLTPAGLKWFMKSTRKEGGQSESFLWLVKWAWWKEVQQVIIVLPLVPKEKAPGLPTHVPWRWASLVEERMKFKSYYQSNNKNGDIRFFTKQILRHSSNQSHIALWCLSKKRTW